MTIYVFLFFYLLFSLSHSLIFLDNQAPKVQNDNQKMLIEILQKASTNYSKPTTETNNKINNWFELELKRNNDHLSPIVKEKNAFTLEDIERN